jgi:hypothetical protein
MGGLEIERTAFDERSGLLSFCARVRWTATPLTIASTIRLQCRPVSETALRWAILKRSAELLDGMA